MNKIKPSFTQKVYNVVAKIPKGKTMSYKEVAARAGSRQAFRAVGNIMNKHNIKGLPCHRVVGSNNPLRHGFIEASKIGGYKWGIKRKIKILKKEGVKINYAETN